MNIIEQVLAAVPRPEGFVGAHLVELGTGQILASVPGPGAPTSGGDAPEGAAGARALAAAVGQALQTLGSVTAVHSVDEDLEDMVVTMSRHHHLARLLPDLAGTDAFLVLTLDRAHSNLALARHLLLRLEVELVP